LHGALNNDGYNRLESATEKIVAGGFRDWEQLRYLIVGHIQFLQRGAKVFHDGVEVEIVEALLDQVGVTARTGGGIPTCLKAQSAKFLRLAAYSPHNT